MNLWTELFPPFSSSQFLKLRRRRLSNIHNTNISNEMMKFSSRSRCECSRIDISHLIYPNLVSPVIQCSLPFYIHKRKRPCPIFVGRKNYCKRCVADTVRLGRINYRPLACKLQRSITPVGEIRIGRPDLDEGDAGGGSGTDGPSRLPRSGTHGRLLRSNLDGRKDYPELLRAIEDGNATEQQNRQIEADEAYYRVDEDQNDDIGVD